MGTLLLVLVVFCLAVYAGISAVIAAATISVSRVPLPDTPAASGLAYEDVSFNSRVDNVSLKGWYIPGEDKGTVIVVHGGKQNRADATMRLTELCCELARKGFNVLTFDRRGCGESEVSKTGVRARYDRDVAGACDYIRDKNGEKERVFILGISIGAVAVFLFAAHEKGICGIISDSCFISAPEMSRRLLAKVNKVLTCFVPSALWMGRRIYGLQPENAIDDVKLVTCPVFFIHGQQDTGVPAGDSVKLFEASKNELNELWLVPGADHCQEYSVSPGRYIDRVVAFIDGKCQPGITGDKQRVLSDNSVR
jgi:alpha-beta hydrolase superfamily lysophospholipase